MATIEVKQGFRAFQPPVRAAPFWIVQAGVLSIALVHNFVLDAITDQHPGFGVTDAMLASLLIIPVIYAALNFGFHGSVATAVWATILIAGHWPFMHPFVSSHMAIELGNLIVLNVVGVVVGQRVEREQRARHGAEMASSLYQGLFEQQPSPVIIADWSGMIKEVNTATTRLFGQIGPGSPLQGILSVTVADLLGPRPRFLSLRTVDGDERLFVPTAHTLELGDDLPLIQIVLTDVTEEHRRQEEQRLFSGRLLAVQEEERHRLSQELHDEPLQDLVYLTRTLDDLSEDIDVPTRLVSTLRLCGELAGKATGELRKVIHGLRPPLLDDIGIASALRQLVADISRRGELSVNVQCTGTEHGLSPDVKLIMYRIVQESLNNVLRHAHARHATIKVRFGDPLILTISDDGRGIPPDQTGSPTGFGLTGMSERATLVGGDLQVSGRSPHGTIVRATLPTHGRSPEMGHFPDVRFDGP